LHRFPHELSGSSACRSSGTISVPDPDPLGILNDGRSGCTFRTSSVVVERVVVVVAVPVVVVYDLVVVVAVVRVFVWVVVVPVVLDVVSTQTPHITGQLNRA